MIIQTSGGLTWDKSIMQKVVECDYQTPYCMAILEKSTVVQLVKKFYTFTDPQVHHCGPKIPEPNESGPDTHIISIP
jgi:nucleoside diphosphate kinase